MTETTEMPTSTGRASRGGGLSGLVLADLKAMAGQLGIKGTSGMRKGDLVAAIAARQPDAGPGATAAGSASNGNGSGSAGAQRPRRMTTGTSAAPDTPSLMAAPEQSQAGGDGQTRPSGESATHGASTATSNGVAHVTAVAAERGAAPASAPERQAEPDHAAGDDASRRDGGRNRRNRRHWRDRDDTDGSPQDGAPQDGAQQDGSQQDGSQQDGSQQDGARLDGARLDGAAQSAGGQARARAGQATREQAGGERDGESKTSADEQGQGRQGRRDDGRRDDGRRGEDDSDGAGRRRGRRYRDRNRHGRDRLAEAGDTEVRDDDVLVPVTGIVDVLDSYAFVRTSGYLAGPNDVYVSMSQVRKYGLRRGDHISGAIRVPREGEQTQQRQKFNPLVKLETINGMDPEASRGRPEFTKLTPLYPNERLRLETESHILTTRVIDMVMPVGKGQRALIVSPPKAGKTMVMQAIANAITTNNPECHLMVVLIDERPEEVTDMQRSVKGEVIASTFDRPPSDHTMAAELSIERAKRLVEMGRDVVVLLDSITRLGRAYNLAAPASGRILSGGVDSTALFPPKRFLGAARNIENGGSLTIFASALVETGSAGDTVIFEEFKGTGNAELKLDRRLADKRIFPAIDIDASSTRKEDLLLAPDELAVTVKLRRLLAALDPQQALELVLERLRKTRTNIEFLMSVAKNMPLND